MERYNERDCTYKCRSSVHAKLIQNCAIIATPSQLRSYSVWLCHNFAAVTDEFGRNLLHVAASCGKYEIINWLLKQYKIDVDIKDQESGWTSLHRSFFYGQLASARILCMNGANLCCIDHEGLTPLDVILKDRLPYIEYLPSDPSEVYVWGSNFNDNLGLGNSQSRNAPEILEFFRKDFIDIQQVQICKFHSVFLSTNGKLYTCGYGYGGRLGQDTENNSLVPSLIKGLESQSCIQVAAGQDHMLILLENGQVWSCGSNEFHQLGLYPPCEKVLVPKPISLKCLNGKKVLGVRAARFYSLIYTQDSVYTFGLNAGQLGHLKGNQFESHPRQVSGLYADDRLLTHVEVSDGAIVCATNRGDVYVLHEYQIRKIASRQLDIKKLSIVGGHLDSQVNVPGVREDGSLELRVALLTKSGKIYLWRQSDPYLRRCIFTCQKEIIVSDIHINHYHIGLITSDNEGYLGAIVNVQSKRTAPPPSTTHVISNFTNKTSSGLVVLLNTSDCHSIKVQKLPNIYRATSITSDPKGRNYAILQSNPKMGLVEVPWLSNSKCLEDYSRLLSETHVSDCFHDVIIKVDKREFAAHKFILASRSNYFKNKLADNFSANGTVIIENAKPEAFEQVLKFIYTNHCDFLTDGYEVKWELNPKNGKNKKANTKISKATNPIVLLKELSKRLNMNSLAKRLENVKLINSKISTQERRSSFLCFERSFLLNFSDVNLISSDGIEFKCHKCILIARLDYFHNMLNSYWAESSRLEQVSLPIPSQILDAILDFLYSDASSKITDSGDVEFLCQTLIFADQLLIPLLKEMCEVSLVKLLTLKNSAELLEISSVYNAYQLKRSCMQFISLNLAAIVELKVLEVLNEDLMVELSVYYRNMIPAMHKRKILSNFNVSESDLITLEQQFPIDNTTIFQKIKSEVHENKNRNRRRCNSLRFDGKDISTTKSNNDSEDCNKNIVIDVLVPKKAEKLDDIIVSPAKEKKADSLKSPSTVKNDKPLHRIMMCPKREEVLSLDQIMSEEEKKLTVLHRKSNMPDIKPMPHLSQKQKKMAKRQNEIASFSPSSPPSQNICPWAKLSAQSPPSPSFWESFSKKDFTPSSLNRELSSPPSSLISSDKNQDSNDIVISLHEIQKAEEKKLLRTINPKIKPLQLINIEDQAIEELSLLYNVKDNLKEKITVSRVQPEEIASPVWKRKH